MKPKCIVTAALAWSLLAANPAPAAAPPPAISGDTGDIASRWEHLLATSELSDVLDAYGGLTAVGYTGDSVDADRCRENAKTLARDIERVPVSVALRRADYLCAQAIGDEPASERSLAELVALSRFALRDAADFGLGRPIRVLGPVDATALVLSSGLEPVYSYYPQRFPARYFTFVIAARDPDTGLERHLPFDYIDAQYRMAHGDPFSGYPIERIVLTRNYIDDDDGVPEAMDRKAVNAAYDGPRSERAGTLRAAAELGGIEASKEWLVECASAKSSHCADGLVDVLLPQAEARHAYPMVLMALAYLDGIGIQRDPDAAWALLDEANRHWRNGEAYERFARVWHDMHGEQAVRPAELESRLAHAAMDGNHYLQLVGIGAKIQAKTPLTPTEKAFLAEPELNRTGYGYELLASDAESRGQLQERSQWLAMGAKAGNAYAQADYGFDLWDGDHGVAVDVASGRRWVEEAAQGGAENAARILARRAGDAGRWHEAEAWLLGPATGSDELAALRLASLYEAGHPGVDGKIDRAIDIYRILDDFGSAEARRRLAVLAFEGRGMPRDIEQGRKYLLKDAEAGDATSMMQLGRAYADGTLGAADLPEAHRWMERALATGDHDARSAYAYFLYYRDGSSEARSRALALWQQSVADGDIGARNNMAWVRCTSPHEVERDGAAGLALAKALGDPARLSASNLDTLAACYAETGDFDRGTALQVQAVSQIGKELADGPPDAREGKLRDYNLRLDLYRAHKPYRVPAPPPAAQSDASKPNNSVSVTSSPTK